jgi:hypothetical protein
MFCMGRNRRPFNSFHCRLKSLLSKTNFSAILMVKYIPDCFDVSFLTVDLTCHHSRVIRELCELFEAGLEHVGRPNDIKKKLSCLTLFFELRLHTWSEIPLPAASEITAIFFSPDIKRRISTTLTISNGTSNSERDS